MRHLTLIGSLCVVSALSLTALPQPVQAQQDSLAAAAVPDTLSLIVGLRVPDELHIPDNLHGDYLLLARSIASAFRSPKPFRLPLWPGTHLGAAAPWLTTSGESVGLGLEGYLVFRLSKQGHL